MHNLFFDLYQSEESAPPSFLKQVEKLSRISHRLFMKGKEVILPYITTKELAGCFNQLLHILTSEIRIIHIHINVNEQAFHCLPGSRMIKPGDILTIDLVLSDGSFFSDGAWTYPVGMVSDERRLLIEQAWQTSKEALLAIQGGDSFSIMQKAVESSLIHPGFRILPEACGHGIGRHVHEDPEIPFVSGAGDLGYWDIYDICTIEPVVVAGRSKIVKKKEMGYVSEEGKDVAYFEHMVLIKPEGPACLNIPEINMIECIDIFLGFH